MREWGRIAWLQAQAWCGKQSSDLATLSSSPCGVSVTHALPLQVLDLSTLAAKGFFPADYASALQKVRRGEAFAGTISQKGAARHWEAIRQGF